MNKLGKILYQPCILLLLVCCSCSAETEDCDDLDVTSWDKLDEGEKSSKLRDLYKLYQSFDDEMTAIYNCESLDTEITVHTQFLEKSPQSFFVFDSPSLDCDYLARAEITATISVTGYDGLESAEMIFDAGFTDDADEAAMYAIGDTELDEQNEKHDWARHILLLDQNGDVLFSEFKFSKVEKDGSGDEDEEGWSNESDFCDLIELSE